MGKLIAGLLGALCVLLLLTIFAADRLYFRLLAVEERLAALEKNPRSASSREEDAPWGSVDEPFANKEYYDPARSFDAALALAISADIPNLNPLTSQEAEASRIHGYCTATIAERNYGQLDRFEPVLAESWEISPDGLVFRIKLRKGVLWHDFTDPVTGKEYHDVEMTADDFAFYFEALRDERVNCAHLRVYYQGVKELRVLGRYEFEISWSEPYFKLAEMTFALSPLPRHYYCPDGVFDPEIFNYDAVRNSHFIGVGPYRISGRKRDVSISLERFDDYFGAPYGVMPGIKNIELVVNKLDSTRFQGLLAGELDMIGLTPDQWKLRTDNSRFAATVKVGEAPFDAAEKFGKDAENLFVRCQKGGSGYSFIGWNLQSPLFRDADTRNALTMLVNREALLESVYSGLAEICTGPFTPGSTGHDPELKPLPFDPERAAALLRRAGWADTDGDGFLDRAGIKFSFSMMQPANNSVMEKIMPVIKDDFARAGIEMRIDIYEWSVFLERIQAKNFDACMLGWTAPLDPDPYQVWHSSQADAAESSNFISFRNQEADRLIEAIRSCTDSGKRMELCREFQRLIHREQPYTFMFVPSGLSAVSAKYNNIRIFPPYLMPETILWSDF